MTTRPPIAALTIDDVPALANRFPILFDAAYFDPAIFDAEGATFTPDSDPSIAPITND